MTNEHALLNARHAYAVLFTGFRSTTRTNRSLCKCSRLYKYVWIYRVNKLLLVVYTRWKFLISC